MRKIRQLLRQVQDAQNHIQQMQYNGVATIENQEVINITINGKGGIDAIKINLLALVQRDTLILSNLIIAAYNNAQKSIDEHTSELMSSVTSKLNKFLKSGYPSLNQKVENKAESTEFNGTAGGKLVTMVLDGYGNIKSINIDSSLLDDNEILEDLIIAAYRNAKSKFEDESASMVSELLNDNR